MKALATLAFGAIALLGANFATAAPASASNVGVYAGSNGFAIQVSNYGDYGYRHHRNRCSNYWYRRNHPYQCNYRSYYPGHYGHYNNYYYNDYRPYRRHWRHRNHRRDYDRRRDRW